MIHNSFSLKKIGGCLLFFSMIGLPISSLAVPMTIEYSDVFGSELGLTASGSTSFSSSALISGFGFVTRVSLPGFDPILGTLQSARLVVRGTLASDLVDHAGAPTGIVRAGHVAETGYVVNTNERLQQIIESSSRPNFDVNITKNYGSVAHTDLFSLEEKCIGNLPPNPHPHETNPGCINVPIPPEVVIKRSRSEEVTFNEVFSGNQLDPFIVNCITCSGENWLKLYNATTSAPGYISGEHFSTRLEGEVNTFLQPEEQSVTGKCSKLCMAIAAARIINGVVDDVTGHPISYSDVHIGTAISLFMSVEYTYDQVAEVPEPSTLSIFTLGLLGISIYKRKRA